MRKGENECWNEYYQFLNCFNLHYFCGFLLVPFAFILALMTQKCQFLDASYDTSEIKNWFRIEKFSFINPERFNMSPASGILVRFFKSALYYPKRGDFCLKICVSKTTWDEKVRRTSLKRSKFPFHQIKKSFKFVQKKSGNFCLSVHLQAKLRWKIEENCFRIESALFYIVCSMGQQSTSTS